MEQEKNKRALGAAGERIVRDYIEKMGMELLEMNFRCRQGEIDLIAKDGQVYVFIEAKYRKTAKYGFPQEAVGVRKQKRICSAAAYYLYKHRLGDNVSVRFDVAALLGDQLTYIKDAFPFQTGGL